MSKVQKVNRKTKRNPFLEPKQENQKVQSSRLAQGSLFATFCEKTDPLSKKNPSLRGSRSFFRESLATRPPSRWLEYLGRKCQKFKRSTGKPRGTLFWNRNRKTKRSKARDSPKVLCLPPFVRKLTPSQKRILHYEGVDHFSAKAWQQDPLLAGWNQSLGRKCQKFKRSTGKPKGTLFWNRNRKTKRSKARDSPKVLCLPPFVRKLAPSQKRILHYEGVDHFSAKAWQQDPLLAGWNI